MTQIEVKVVIDVQDQRQVEALNNLVAALAGEIKLHRLSLKPLKRLLLLNRKSQKLKSLKPILKKKPNRKNLHHRKKPRRMMHRRSKSKR